MQIQNQDIEIADGAQSARDFPQASLVFRDRLAAIVGADKIEEAAHAADGHAHLMHGFDIFAGAAAGFVALHTAELTGKDLPPRLGHGIRGENLRFLFLGLVVVGSHVRLFVLSSRNVALISRQAARFGKCIQYFKFTLTNRLMLDRILNMRRGRGTGEFIDPAVIYFAWTSCEIGMIILTTEVTEEKQ